MKADRNSRTYSRAARSTGTAEKSRSHIRAAFLLLIAGLLFTAGAAYGMGGREASEEEGRKSEQASAAGENGAQTVDSEGVDSVYAVNTTTAVSGQIKDYIKVNGDVETKTSVDVYPDTSGKLIRIFIDVGDTVRKDSVIAEVDPSKAGMNFVASPIKAPITGTITQIPARIGQTVSPSVPIAKVSRTWELEISTEVSERFISRMEEGQPAILNFAAYPGETFRARVTELSPVVDPVSRTMGVTLQPENGYERIKPGMFAEVKIITQAKEGIVKIPAECMVSRFGKYFVFVAKEDGTVERRNITPGIQIDQKLEVTEGLEAGEEIVIRGQTLLEDGVRVKVIDQVPPLSQADVIE